MMHRNIRSGVSYKNNSGKSRYVIQTDYNIETRRTRVCYVKTSLYEPVKSCYLEQFIRWLES
jgi:hypothetical protein